MKVELRNGADLQVGDVIDYLTPFVVARFEPYEDAEERLGHGPARVAVSTDGKHLTVFDDSAVRVRCES